MVSSVVVSSVFLACYLVYHYQVGERGVPAGPGRFRTAYLTILLSHTRPGDLWRRAARHFDADSGDSPPVGPPRQYRSGDVPGLVLRLGDWGRHLLDALPDADSDLLTVNHGRFDGLLLMRSLPPRSTMGLCS